MSITYKDEDGNEIIIHDLEESKKMRQKYNFPNNDENTCTKEDNDEDNKKYSFEDNNINDKKQIKRFLIKQLKKDV